MKFATIILILILTSASVSSQESLPVKTKYQGKNAVILPEVLMDSVTYAYIERNELKSKNSKLKLQVATINLQNTILLEQKDKLESANKKSEEQISLLQQKMESEKRIHDAEILYYKEKSKGKFTAFALGTAAGAVLVFLIQLLL